MRYYIAYGSNIITKDLKMRCPDSKIVGKSFLEDFKLEFKKYLNIKKEKGSKVPVLVIEVSERDERRLDEYENYPALYIKEEIYLKDLDITAFYYIITDINKPLEPPREGYLKGCLNGYKEHGFDTKYILDALEETKRFANK